MSAHTPGPWSEGKPAADGTVKISDAGGQWVARVHFRNGDKTPDAEAAANARLIAAAPDLLAAAKQLVERISNGESPTCDETLHAIAKAEGGA